MADDYGNTFLVEQCQKISINELIASFNKVRKLNFIKNQLDVAGISIDLIATKTGYGGLRYWFRCPQCEARVGVVYKHSLSHVVGCRLCLKLDYKSHRFKGMIENSTD